MTFRRLSPYLPDAAALAIVAAAFIHAASYSWLRWGDILIDSGMVLAWPQRVLEGALLYRDLHYPYGPLDIYLNAGLYAVFGSRTETIFAAGLACAAVSVAALYALCRMVLRPWLAVFPAAAFIYDCAFGHLSGYGGYNFVLPYAASATYGMAAALASLALLARSRVSAPRGAVPFGTGRAELLAGSCLLLAAAALTKIEIALTLAAAHACVWALPDIRPRRRAAAAHYGAALLLAASVYGFFAWKAGAGVLLWENLLAPQHREAWAQAALAGLDSPWENLGLGLLSLAVTGAVLGLASLPLYWRPKGLRWALSAAAVYAAWSLGEAMGPSLQFRCLPVLAAVMLAWRLAGRMGREEAGAFDAFLPVMVFGVLMTGRIALRTSAAHYGFFMLVPGLAVYHYALLRWAPERLGLRGTCFHWPVLLFLAVLASKHAEASRAAWSNHTVELSTPRGRWRVRGGNTGEALKQVETFLRAQADCATVAAVPEGIALSFLSKKRHPHPHYAYLPNTLPSPQAALALFERTPPDCVLSLPRDLTEFGFRRFEDFAPSLAAGLSASYRIEAVIASTGAPGPPYRAVIMRAR